MSYDNYCKKVDEAVNKMEIVLGELDYLQANISQEIEDLEQLRGEILERAEKLSCAIDLNKEMFR